MVNKNYKRGYTTEMKAIKELEEQGFYAVRTAGSHGVFDIMAVPTTRIKAELLRHNDEVWMIQLKRTKADKLYKSSYKKDIEQIKGVEFINSNIKKKLWIWQDRIGWEKEDIQ